MTDFTEGKPIIDLLGATENPPIIMVADKVKTALRKLLSENEILKDHGEDLCELLLGILAPPVTIKSLKVIDRNLGKGKVHGQDDFEPTVYLGVSKTHHLFDLKAGFGFENTEAKEKLAIALRETISLGNIIKGEEEKIDIVVMISEAWMSAVSRDTPESEQHKITPSKAANRQEVFILTYEQIDFNTGKVTHINVNYMFWLNKIMVGEGDNISSRFTVWADQSNFNK